MKLTEITPLAKQEVKQGPDCPTHADVLGVVNNTANPHTTLKVLDHLSMDPPCAECNVLESLENGIKTHSQFIEAEVNRVMNCTVKGCKKRAANLKEVHEKHFALLKKFTKK